MSRVSLVILFWVLLVYPYPLDGGHGPDAKKALEPKLFTLPRKSQPLSAWLDFLHSETGNLVLDRRRTVSNASLLLDPERTSFWQALAAIADKANCDISLYEADGKLALVEKKLAAARKKEHSATSGIFFIRAKRVTLAKDLETNTHTCTITLEVAWEPRFEPFYLDPGPVHVVFSSDGNAGPRIERAPGRGQVSVAGRVATEVEVRLPGPDRKSPTIQLVEGTLRVIGPSKMLDFRFDKLQPIKKSEERRTQSQDGVKVTLLGIKAARERWTVDVLVENPAGGPVFESYQTWLDNNRIALERGKERWIPEPDAEEQLEDLTATRAVVRYYFTTKGFKGEPSEWTLLYRTPGRIVEATAPFSFKNLPLP